MHLFPPHSSTFCLLRVLRRPEGQPCLCGRTVQGEDRSGPVLLQVGGGWGSVALAAWEGFWRIIHLFMALAIPGPDSAMPLTLTLPLASECSVGGLVSLPPLRELHTSTVGRCARGMEHFFIPGGCSCSGACSGNISCTDVHTTP